MMCIKHILIFFLLLPIPAASPIFLFLFGAAAFIAVKPCGYCLSLLAILFLSTSPLSPFLHPSLSSQSPVTTNTTTATTATSNAQTQQLPLDSPIPGRSWFNVNGGRFSQPSLVGYKEMDKALSKAGEGSDTGFSGLTKRFFAFERISARPPLSSSGSASASSESEQPVRRSILDQIVAPYLPLTYPSSAVSRSDDALSSVSVWRDRPMPKQHVDLSWKGVGMIVDFGWKRSEDGIKYEIEEALGREWVRPPVSSEAEVDTERAARGGQAGKDDEEEQQETATRDSVPDAEEEALPSAGNAKSGFWGRIPLVGGSW